MRFYSKLSCPLHRICAHRSEETLQNFIIAEKFIKIAVGILRFSIHRVDWAHFGNQLARMRVHQEFPVRINKINRRMMVFLIFDPQRGYEYKRVSEVRHVIKKRENSLQKHLSYSGDASRQAFESHEGELVEAVFLYREPALRAVHDDIGRILRHQQVRLAIPL